MKWNAWKDGVRAFTWKIIKMKMITWKLLWFCRMLEIPVEIQNGF